MILTVKKLLFPCTVLNFDLYIEDALRVFCEIETALVYNMCLAQLHELLGSMSGHSLWDL